MFLGSTIFTKYNYNRKWMRSVYKYIKIKQNYSQPNKQNTQPEIMCI